MGAGDAVASVILLGVGVVLLAVAIVAPVLVVRALGDIRQELRLLNETVASGVDDLAEELREGGRRPPA